MVCINNLMNNYLGECFSVKNDGAYASNDDDDDALGSALLYYILICTLQIIRNGIAHFILHPHTNFIE